MARPRRLAKRRRKKDKLSAPPTPVIQHHGQLVLRFREPLVLLCYLAGFLAPWERSGSHATLWLVASTWVARSGWLDVANATVTVTWIALACLATGAILRLRLVTARPHGQPRNPFLYLGSWLLALGTSILMPPSGAAFFIISFSLLGWFLILREGRVLHAGLADASNFIFPVEPRPWRPAWLAAILAEAFPITFTTCFAVFAWRYNARILEECLLICYGVSLLVRGVASPASQIQKLPAQGGRVQEMPAANKGPNHE